MKFKELLKKYRDISFSERDKGDRFERLMQAYLQTDPKYANKFKNVWLWDEFPGKIELGGQDTGIDLVALTHEGDYWAIQCKFYSEDSTIDKPAVDSFLATSSRTFLNEQLQTTRFAQRLWISTTNKWGSNAVRALQNQSPPVTRLNLSELNQAPVDWKKLEQGIHGESARTPKKSPFKHQLEAIETTHAYFKENNRGKLIMACGTGKTYTALKIAENETKGKGTILFLVPSIALLGQTLRAWTEDSEHPINAVCICSDPKITRDHKTKDGIDGFSVIDLALPASTDVNNILRQFKSIRDANKEGMTVVFSTYQSIDVIAEVQKQLLENNFGEFDLIICDEAHRTTGVTLAGEDESAFVKVHDNDFIKGKKRMYMTATPRLYDIDAQSKAAMNDAVLCSMDDDTLYGEEIYHIGFGRAVEENMLTDYKVLVLTLNDKDIPASIQSMIANDEFEVDTDDASKIIGTINALSKQFIGDGGITKQTDPKLMKRAVAFCSNIKNSKEITTSYNTAGNIYLDELPDEYSDKMVSTEARHMDGTMSAPERDELLDWLKDDDTPDNECRIITNVRVLSEGVDVPSLDSVLFLSARNSQVDVVQSVGRVMRKAPGKKYGYIIIPVVIPSDVDPAEALQDNNRYKVVWTVLNALRAHDDRFNATVNKIELNKRKPNNILIGRPEFSFSDDWDAIRDDENVTYGTDALKTQLSMQFQELQNVIYAKMVEKVGDRRYWEQWAKDIALTAERQMERIKNLIETRESQREAFDKFLSGLQRNINPSIGEGEAIEMLAQHIITEPVFDALFENYSFDKNNAVSSAMQSMLDALEGKTVAEENDQLQKFYAQVRRRVEGIDNAEGKQKIIIELYDKFFKNAFPKLVEQLGIVYTPVEVVDFIIHSVDDVLKKEFNRNISDENIHILDPFTGTGTFITRLLQSGLIKKEDLERKYKHEIHANEFVLLAYYIAAVNIENVYHDLAEKDEFEPFDGIVLTDTFQLGESDGEDELFSEMLYKNFERVEKQKKAPLRVIMGNPPYSAGQKSADDNAQNQEYRILNSRIKETYQAYSTGPGRRSLYDAYIKAFRWSTDRLNNNEGIICFITNSSWLYGKATVGFRKYIEEEFSTIYIYDLKGAIRGKSGNSAKKEGGNIFDIMTGVAITILVKNPKSNHTKANIYYTKSKDYISKESKLTALKELKSYYNKDLSKKVIKPNKHGDWLNKGNELFDDLIPVVDKDKKTVNTFFNPILSYGMISNRDKWVWNFKKNTLKNNIKTTIEFYNSELERFNLAKKETPNIKARDFIEYNPKKISWDNRKLIGGIKKNRRIEYLKSKIKTASYRPFCKQKVYFDKQLCHSLYLQEEYFPTQKSINLLICFSPDNADGISLLISNSIVDLHYVGDTRCLPLYYYEESDAEQSSLFDPSKEDKYIRRDGISDFIYERAKAQYGKNVTKEDIFYYVYGILHSKDYRKAFANDLKKMLPRLPLLSRVKDFWVFSKAGRALADLHLNYENQPINDAILINDIPVKEFLAENTDDVELFKVQKIRFAKKKEIIDGKSKTVNDKTAIQYNGKITISNIPEKAYEYVVNGRSAIEWILDRYQVKTDKKSGITNDPNDWAEEVGNPRYILDLLLSLVTVSLETMEIVNNLPAIDFEEE